MGIFIITKCKRSVLKDNRVFRILSEHRRRNYQCGTRWQIYCIALGLNNAATVKDSFVGKGVKKNKISKVTSQLNILPTILNLYGISYNTNNYIAEDALDNKYDGVVFFSDYSWYNGNVYVENGEVTNNKKISLSKLEEKNEYISYITKKNDLTLKYNYFKMISSD